MKNSKDKTDAITKSLKKKESEFQVVLYDDFLLYQVLRNQSAVPSKELEMFALENKRRVILRFNKLMANTELWENVYFKLSIKIYANFSILVKNQRGEILYRRENAKRKSFLPEGKLVVVENLCQIALMQVLLKLWKEQKGEEIVVKYAVDTGHMSETELPLLSKFAKLENIEIDFCRFD